MNCGVLATPVKSISYNGECCNPAAVDYMNKNFLFWINGIVGLSGYVATLKGKGLCNGVATTKPTVPTTSTVIPSITSSFNCSWLNTSFEASSSPEYGAYNGSCCTQKALEVLERKNLSRYLNSKYSDRNKWLFLSRFLFCEEGACTENYLDNCSTTETSSTSTTSLAPLNCSWLRQSFHISSIGIYDGSCCTQIALDALEKENLTLTLFDSPYSIESRWSFIATYLFCVEGACSATYRENCSESTTSIPTTTPPLNCSWLGEPLNFTLVVPDYQYQGSCCTQTALDAIANQNLTTYFAGSNYSISKRWTLISKFLFCIERACLEPDPIWTNCTTHLSSTDYEPPTTNSPASTTSTEFLESTAVSEELTTEPVPVVSTSISMAFSSTYQSTSETIETSTFTETETFSSTSSSTSSATPIPSSSEPYSTESSELITTTLSTSLEPSTSEHSSSTSKSTTSSTTLGFETSTLTESTSSIPSTLGFSSSIKKSTTSSSTLSSEPSTTTVSTSSKTSTLERSSSTSQSTTSSSRTSTLFSSESDVKTFNTTTPKVFSSSSTHSENVKSTEAKTSTSKSTEKYISTTSTSFKTNPTTTFNWPTGGTTRLLPSGEIIISESLISYPNCTTVLYQLILNPSTNVTRTETESDPEGFETTSTTLSTAVTSSKSTETSTTAPRTTTFPWPTGGTTKVLPNGEIIISESLISYPNCTTILYQLILNPSTNMTRTETASDSEGCKTTSTAPVTPSKSTKPSTTSKISSGTTTFNWPTGGTTRLLPSGEIIISESLVSYPNCTTVLYQLILNPSTNTTRTKVISDPNGCLQLTTTPRTTVKTSTTPSTSSGTTTFDWPTGGTTRLLPNGEIIISESLISYPNCTTILYQLILNPSKNTTRTETILDPNGCKTTTPLPPKTVTTPITPSHNHFEDTTPFNGPTGGTTRHLPTDRDEKVPKATTTQTAGTPGATSTEFPFTLPESKTTRLLPGGEILLSESLVTYKNCTTILYQLILNPSTNVTRTEVSSDAEGCKAFSSTRSPETTTFNWPTVGTTRLLPSGEVIISETLVTHQNCTTALYQLILNPSTNLTRTEITSDAEGCKATTTLTPSTSSDFPSNSTSCAPLSLDLTNTNRPTSSEIKSSYSIGSRLYHVCQQYFVFQTARQPYKIYVCMSDGTWNGDPESCVADKQDL